MSGQSTDGIELEDHGSEVRSVTRLKCDFEGCNRTPEHRAFGYIHFSFDGSSYSRDTLEVCSAHKVLLDRYVDTDTDQQEADQ
jgi:hypothetical protein